MSKGPLTDPQAMVIGQCPHTAYADTSAHPNLKHFALKVVEAAVFTSLTDEFLTGTVAGWSFASGDMYFGDISAFQLASGKIIGFDRPLPQS